MSGGYSRRVGAPSRLVELLPGVWLATSRQFATTTTVLLDGSGGAVVVDPAWDPDELSAIPADLAALGVRCVAGLATHEHYDHVLWHPGLGQVPRWASQRTAERLDTDREAILKPAVEFLTPDLLAVAGRLVALPSSILPWSGPSARVVEHDAHAPGHVALILTGPSVLVCGDMLSDIELPMPAASDPNLDTYREGLEALAEAVRGASWLIPGHGSPTNKPGRRLDADLRYLDDVQVRGHSDDPRIQRPGMRALHASNLRRAGVDGQG